MLFAGGCRGLFGDSDDTPPVLAMPMVDLATIREFLPFGALLSVSGRLNAAYELRLLGTSLEIRAVSKGTVERILQNDPAQGDSEIHVRPTKSSTYLVIYDHVRNLRVRAGDAVDIGTILGTIGNWSATEGRVELQINHRDLAVCPRSLGSASFNAAHEAAMTATGTPRALCLTETVQP